jgi:di/tricarboxylate transporter
MRERLGPLDTNGRLVSRPGGLWWCGHLLLTAIACFFVFFGISLLMAAYQLTDPFSFIMTFFAASLIILISAVMVLGFIVRMSRSRRSHHRKNDGDPAS